jgi:hypothetical protein
MIGAYKPTVPLLDDAVDVLSKDNTNSHAAVSVEPDTVDSSRYWTLQTPIHALDTIWRILILSVSTTALEYVARKIVHFRDECTL